MQTITDLLPLILPLALVQLVLMGFALVDLARRDSTRGPKWLWALVVIFVSTIGPILYFVLGRQEE